MKDTYPVMNFARTKQIATAVIELAVTPVSNNSLDAKITLTGNLTDTNWSYMDSTDNGVDIMNLYLSVRDSSGNLINSIQLGPWSCYYSGLPGVGVGGFVYQISGSELNVSKTITVKNFYTYGYSVNLEETAYLHIMDLIVFNSSELNLSSVTESSLTVDIDNYIGGIASIYNSSNVLVLEKEFNDTTVVFDSLSPETTYYVNVEAEGRKGLVYALRAITDSAIPKFVAYFRNDDGSYSPGVLYSADSNSGTGYREVEDLYIPDDSVAGYKQLRQRT